MPYTNVERDREMAKLRRQRWRAKRREQGLTSRSPEQLRRAVEQKRAARQLAANSGVPDPEDFGHPESDVRVGP